MVCFYIFPRLETFYQGVSSSDFQLGSQRHRESQILPFAASASGYYFMIQQQMNVMYPCTLVVDLVKVSYLTLVISPKSTMFSFG